MAIVCKVSGKTDKGLVRKGNEDNLLIDAQHNLYAVCDGMGGAQAGEVASLTASQILGVSFKHFQDDLHKDQSLNVGEDFPVGGDILVKSIRLANREIHNRAVSDSTLAGMGTTIVAVALESDIMSIAHVGDSRCYQITEKKLVPLTVDHSWVQELQDSQGVRLSEAEITVGRNVITRALGVRKNVEVDYRLTKVKPGELFLLCSDGLCGYADDNEIFDVIKRCNNDIEKIADLLVKSANERGGMDNVTVIVIKVEKIKDSDKEPLKMMTLSSENDQLLQAEDAWLIRLKEKIEQMASQKPEEAAPEAAKKTTLIAIFAAFLIVAVVILILFSGK